MSAKSKLINRLKTNKKTRESYIRAKININLPSQIRALRLRQTMKQEDLAREAEMLQPRISAMERPGATKFNLETLIRLAAALKIGLIVKFVSFSEMLKWENDFSQDTFNVLTIDDDVEFQREDLGPASVIASFQVADELTRQRGNQNLPSQNEPTISVGLQTGPSGLDRLAQRLLLRDPVSHASP